MGVFYTLTNGRSSKTGQITLNLPHALQSRAKRLFRQIVHERV